MKTIILVFTTVAIGTALCGCSTQRWRINDTQMSIEDHLIRHNSVLLDTRTGETWLWWTSENGGGPGAYIWKKLPKSE